MMHGDDEFSASLIRHLYRLLRRAVARNPGVVGANWHHHDVGRLLADRREACPRRIAGNADAPTLPFEHIAIEAAINIISHPRAPVFDPARLDGQPTARRIELTAFGPLHL